MAHNRLHKNRQLLIAFGVCAVVVLSWAGFGTRSAIEATALMEQLASKIDHVKQLHPDTARQLEALMDLPQYDCARVACRSELQDRNRAARLHLKQSIASQAHPREFVASDK